MGNQRGLVQRIERMLEDGVSDAFARVFGGSIVPQELEAVLRREASDGLQTLAGEQLLAPNEYVITLGASDYQKLGADHDLTSRAFAGHLTGYLHDQGWQTYGEVVVRLEQSEALHTGQFRARASVNPDADPRPSPTATAPAQLTHAPTAEPGAPSMTEHPGYPGGQGQGRPGDEYYEDPYARPQEEQRGAEQQRAAYPPEQGYPPRPAYPDQGGYPPEQGYYPGPPAQGYSPGAPGYPQAPQPNQPYGPGYDQRPPAGAYDQGYRPPPPGYGPPQHGQPPHPQAQYAPPQHGQPPHPQAQYGPPAGYPPPRYDEPGYGHPEGRHETRQPYPEHPAPEQPGYPQPDYGRAEYGQPEYGQPEYGRSDYGQPEYGQPDYRGHEQPGYPQQHAAAPDYDYGQPPAPGGYPGYPGAGTSVTLQLDDGSGRTYQLREGANVIGRGQDAQFRLPDTGVSRRHLEIRWDGQVALLSDLNSTNGTTVNNAPVQEWQLADGDVIRVGHSEIVVHVR